MRGGEKKRGLSSEKGGRGEFSIQPGRRPASPLVERAHEPTKDRDVGLASQVTEAVPGTGNVLEAVLRRRQLLRPFPIEMVPSITSGSVGVASQVAP